MNTMYIITIILAIIYFILVVKYQNRINNELTIIQVNEPNYSQIENIVYSRNPAILTGMIENIKELYQWDPDYFKQKFPNELITVQTSLIEQSKSKFINISMDKYIDFINNIKHENYYSWQDKHFLKKHSLDIPIKKYFSQYFNESFSEYFLSISPNKYRKGLHCNLNNLSIICQIYGQKSIYLFNPDQRKFLYPSNKLLKNGEVSNVHFWDKNSHKDYPLFKDAKYIEIKLSPGQLFIIPPFWWYCFETIDNNIDIVYKGDIVFQKISNISHNCKVLLHNCGLYKTNDCTCCNL